jgi:uncharacterized membrane protein YqjE
MTYQEWAAGAPASQEADQSDGRTVGELISEVADDFARLTRQQLDLAKVELKEQAVAAGRAGAMLSVAAVAGLMVVVLLSFGLVYALAEVMSPGWAALIVAAVWAIVGTVAYAAGRRRLQAVKPVPEKTVETLKEDMRWLRNPTG